jgi:hypothetical protein
LALLEKISYVGNVKRHVCVLFAHQGLSCYSSRLTMLWGQQGIFGRRQNLRYPHWTIIIIAIRSVDGNIQMEIFTIWRWKYLHILSNRRAIRTEFKFLSIGIYQ